MDSNFQYINLVKCFKREKNLLLSSKHTELHQITTASCVIK